MLIFWGTRTYGRVDELGGEHAVTRFFHIYFLPLVPRESVWIMPDGAGGELALPIRLHGKSIAVGYARVWAPVAALAAGAFATSFAHVALAAIAVALAAWAWTTGSVVGKRAIRESTFDLLAFGQRCRAARLTRAHRETLQTQLQARWRAASPDGSPEDIAAHGTPDRALAIVAYGVLRLAGLARGRAGAAEHAAADRIVNGEHAAVIVGDGPYRAAALGVAGPVDVETTHEEVRTSEQHRTRRRYRIGLALATLVGISAANALVSPAPIRDVTEWDLTAYEPTTDDVRVECLELVGVTDDSAHCVRDDGDVTIKLPPGSDLRQRVLVGKIRPEDFGINMIDVTARTDPRIRPAVSIVLLLGALFAWIAYIRWARRR